VERSRIAQQMTWFTYRACVYDPRSGWSGQNFVSRFVSKN